MDNLNNNNSNRASYDNSLYSEELKSSSNSNSNSNSQQQQQPKLISPHRQRAMSFLYCISKRLGRRVQHELVVYNSQDDLRSSSTDSFSLSLDRNSSAEKHVRSSSIDLSSDGQSSRASSSSGSSLMSSSGNDENDELNAINCPYQQQHRHSYEPSCYHQQHNDDDDEDDEADQVAAAANNSSYKFSARTPLKGLHLNRISISSVSRVLQHISSSSSSSNSMRSLSCNSTPLKRSKKEPKDKQASNSSSNKTESKKPAKPQPQQQRILRQPVNYVYLKGMSGLPTRRVPRSSLCCSYAYR